MREVTAPANWNEIDDLKSQLRDSASRILDLEKKLGEALWLVDKRNAEQRETVANLKELKIAAEALHRQLGTQPEYCA